VLEVPLNRPGAAGSLRARGITKESLAPYRAAGGQGFGIRSALYRPGLALDAVERAARAFTEAWSMGFE
jgi:2-dehydro-3-deoxyphosphogalactonate aldolase